jgi:ribonuclease III
VTPNGPDLDGLSRRIGYEFTDAALLAQALAHRSWCSEHPGTQSNERLEFLGDAILGFVVAEHAYMNHSDLPEGKLTDLRKAVVNAMSLADVAREVSLGAEIRLGKGESMANGHDKPSILSDALEAVIGAVYLDGGIEQASALIERLIGPGLERAVSQLDELDQKTALQELLARLEMKTPVYVLREEGPDHQKNFFAEVRVNNEVLGRGEGRSKKLAEVAAAREAGAMLRLRVNA